MANKQAPSTRAFIPYEAIRARCCHRIPSCLFRSGKLTPPELILWGSFANFALFNGDCYPTIEALSTDTKIPERSVNRHIRALIKKGFLRIVPRSESKSSHRSNSYELLQHPVFDSVLKTQQNAAKLAQTECQLGTSTNANLAPKRKREKEIKITTTTRGSCKKTVEFDASAKGGCGFSLSPEEFRYIQLKVDYVKSRGRLREDSSWALENDLKRRAHRGELDISDFEHLKKWKTAQDATCIGEEGSSLPDKVALHADVAARDEKARRWWNSLEETHPAKQDKKPGLWTESFWLRHQFKKYGFSGDAS